MYSLLTSVTAATDAPAARSSIATSVRPALHASDKAVCKPWYVKIVMGMESAQQSFIFVINCNLPKCVQLSTAFDK